MVCPKACHSQTDSTRVEVKTLHEADNLFIHVIKCSIRVHCAAVLSYLHEAKREKQLSAGVGSHVPFLSPVGNHGRECTSVQVTVVRRVSLTCTVQNITERIQQE